MKIRLLSDLHFEFCSYNFAKFGFEYQGEDVLVLAGDIAVGAENVYNAFRYFLDLGVPKIVYVPGNHEYYNGVFKCICTDPKSMCCSFDDQLRRFLVEDEDAIDRVYPLYGNFIRLGDVSFIGATLWTNFRDNPLSAIVAGRAMNDFRIVKGLTTELAASTYRIDLAAIKKLYEELPGKKVIITHFLPATECISDRFRDGSLLNDYFANDLGSWISTLKNTTWMFGHTHDSKDFYIGETRMLCNPYGYYRNEINPDFLPEKVYEI